MKKYIILIICLISLGWLQATLAQQNATCRTFIKPAPGVSTQLVICNANDNLDVFSRKCPAVGNIIANFHSYQGTGFGTYNIKANSCCHPGDLIKVLVVAEGDDASASCLMQYSTINYTKD